MSSFNERVKNLLIRLYEIGALKFGDFKMKVGVNSPVYFDLRVIVSHPDLMIEVSHLMSAMVNESSSKPDHVCGVPYTALPIATLVSTNLSIPMLVRRKEAKAYGTGRLIEGCYQKGQSVIIIEDVVTSGSSILETARDLQSDGLKITEAVVVLDREQGGTENLKEKGLKMRSMCTLTRAIEILHEAGKVDNSVKQSVKEYIAKVQIRADGSSRLVEPEPSYLTLSYEKRANLASNSARILYELMSRKKTNLCLAADVDTSEELLRIVQQVAPYVAVIKTHSDAISDWSEETASKLRKMSGELDFLIMEDRKMGDIGHTVARQWQLLNSWANFVTVHALPGENMLQAFQGSAPVFLLAQMSSKGNLLIDSYTKQVVSLAKGNPNLVSGLVCQSPLENAGPGLIRLIPGVRLDEKKEDSLGQQYNDPTSVVIKKGADLAVVGRGILQASDIVKAAKDHRDALWSAYLKRIQ